MFHSLGTFFFCRSSARTGALSAARTGALSAAQSGSLSAARSGARSVALSGTLVVALGIAPVAGLEARVRCYGPACVSVPADDARRQLTFLSLHLQYQERIRRENLRAASLANLMRTSGGGQKLEGFSAGLGSGSAWTASNRMDAHVPGAGSFTNLPVSGSAVQPSLSLGANLARLRELLGKGVGPVGPERSSAPFSLGRFDLYLHMVHARAQDQDWGHPREQSARGSVRSRGAELRYQILEERALGKSSLRFLGLSVGIGYHGTNSTLTIREPVTRVGYSPSNPTGEEQPVIWDLSNDISMKAHLNTMPLELRGGMSLWVFDLYLGLGAARHKGNGRFSTVGVGPAYNASNVQGAVEGAAVGASAHADAVLGMLLSGQNYVNISNAYSRIGIEVGPEFLRVSAEYLIDPRARGLYFGLRCQW